MSILVPIDVSAPARAAVEVASTLARALEESVVLVHAHVGPDPADLEVLAALHELAEPVRDQGIQVHLRVLTGDPVSNLCDWANAHDISLIVTGTRGPQDLTIDRSASTARALSQCASVPVVAVRPGRDGLGMAGGGIHLVDPAHRTARHIAERLGAVWARSPDPVEALTSAPYLSGGVADEVAGLTVVSVGDRTPWSAWCEAVLLHARGTLLIVTRGDPEAARGSAGKARRVSTR